MQAEGTVRGGGGCSAASRVPGCLIWRLHAALQPQAVIVWCSPVLYGCSRDWPMGRWLQSSGTGEAGLEHGHVSTAETPPPGDCADQMGRNTTDRHTPPSIIVTITAVVERGGGERMMQGSWHRALQSLRCTLSKRRGSAGIHQRGRFCAELGLRSWQRHAASHLHLNCILSVFELHPICIQTASHLNCIPSAAASTSDLHLHLICCTTRCHPTLPAPSWSSR